MVRDIRATEEYFYSFTENRKKMLRRFEEAGDNALDEDKKRLCYQEISTWKLQIFTALYSAGAELSEIRTELHKYLQKAGKYINEGRCVELIDYTSLAVTLELDEDDFRLIYESSKRLTIRRKREEDWFLVFLLHSRLPEIPYKDFPIRLPVLYEPYAKIMASDTPVDDLYLYLRRRWYIARKGIYWWGSHLTIQEGLKIYFGYWSLEAAALCKILGWDDEKLKEIKYYPYDLAHYHYNGE